MKNMSKHDIYVGIKNPSVITRVIAHYSDSVHEFEERLDEFLKVQDILEL